MRRLVFLVVCLFPFFAFAQTGTEVSVSLTLTPPYSPYFSDYSDLLDQGIITVTNLTTQQQSLKIIGYVESDNGLAVRTNDNYQPIMPVVLQPLETKVILASQQNQDFLDANNIDTEGDDATIFNIVQTGILPEGNYQICLQAIDYLTNLPLSPEACTYFPIVFAQPPFLSVPLCDDTVEVINNILQFSWLPVSAPTFQPIVYDLYIVPFFPGQNPNDAMQAAINFGAGNPIVKTNLITTNAITLPSDLPLQSGSWYAWCVVAHDPSETVWIENNGRSEVCTFYVRPPDILDVTTYASDPSPNSPVIPDYQMPPIALVSGNLKYRFYEDAGSGWASVPSLGGIIGDYNNWYSNENTSSSSSGTAGSYGGIDPDALYDLSDAIDLFNWDNTPPPAYVLPPLYNGGGGLPLKHTNIVFTARYAIGTGSGVNSINDLQVIYPVGGTPVSLVTPGSGTISLGPASIQAGAATTNADGDYVASINMLEPFGLIQAGPVTVQTGSGEFVSTYSGNGLYRLLTMEVVDPRYCHPDAYLFPQPDQPLEVPQQVVVVKSFNLNVEVRSNDLADQAAGTDNELEGIVVRIGRLASTYNNFPPSYPQGESRMTEFGYTITDQYNGPNVYLCDSMLTNGQGSALFKRLVRSLGPCDNGDEGMYVYTSQADGYFLEAFSHPYIGNYNYSKRTFWNVAPCPGGPNSFYPNDPLMRSVNYQPPVQTVEVVLTPKDPEIYVSTRSDYGLGPEPLPFVNLMFEVQKPNGPLTWTVLQTDQNGLLKKQIGPADYFNGFAWKSMGGIFDTGYRIIPIKSGYTQESCNCTGIGGDYYRPRMGERWNVEAFLEPRGQVKGIVRDEDGDPVEGEIRIGDGVFLPLETTLVYTPDPDSGSGTAIGTSSTSDGGGFTFNGPMFELDPDLFSFDPDPEITLNADIPITIIGMDNDGGPVYNPVETGELPGTIGLESVFNFPAQSGANVPVIVRPYATQLFTDTFYVSIPANSNITDLGVLVLKKKLHRPVVTVRSNSQAIAGVPIPNAEVIISDLDPVYTNSSGVASLVFPSPASEFRIQVHKEGAAIYDEHVVIPVSKDPYPISVFLSMGHTLSGTVYNASNGQVLPGARVRCVVGSNAYGEIASEVMTDQTGAFTLSGVPSGNREIEVTCVNEEMTFEGNTQWVSIPAQGPMQVYLNPAPFHLPSLWNLPVAVTSIQQEPGGWKIGGALVDIPANDRFKTEKPDQRLHFQGVMVSAVNNSTNSAGQVLVEPVATELPLIENQFRSIINDIHVVNMTGAPGSGGILQPVHPLLPAISLNTIKLKKNASNGNGELRVKGYLMLEAFRMAYQYNSHFYLGETASSADIAAFKGSADQTMPLSYHLMDLSFMTQFVRDPQFTVHDFPAYADRNESYLQGDSLTLQTKLVVNLPQSNPDQLIVDAGHIQILPDEIRIFPGNTGLQFNLETWEVQTNSWTFSEQHGGILTSGTIKTNIFDIEAPMIIIRPQELILPGAQSFDLDQMSMSGIAPIQFMPGTNLSFGYQQAPQHDPQNGHWRMALFNPDEVVGYVQGLPGWNPGVKLNFMYTENYSDGYLDFTLSPNQYINHYNVINQWVTGLTRNSDGFTLNGPVDLGIPNLSTGFGLNMVYYKEGGQVKVRPNGLNTNFETYGQVFFSGDQQASRINLDWNLLEVPGWMTIYDDASPNTIALRALLTKTPEAVRLDVMKVDGNGLLAGNNFQKISLGGGNTGKQVVLEGYQLVQNDAWVPMEYLAKFEGYTGSMEEGQDKMWFKVSGAITNDTSKPESITLANVPTPFGDFNLVYEFSNMEIVGTLGLSNIPFGTVVINEGSAEMRIGGRGFYLLAALNATYPVVGTLQTNLITGWYPEITPQAEAALIQGMYLERIPDFMQNDGIHGLYICANKPLIQDDWEINLIVFSAGLYINTGMDAQFWVNFSDNAGGAHIGGLAYFEMELYASVLGICTTCFGFLAELGLSADMTWNPSTDFSATLCGTLGVNMSMCGETVNEQAKAIGTFSSSQGLNISLSRGEACGNAMNPGSNGCIHFN